MQMRKDFLTLSTAEQGKVPVQIISYEIAATTILQSCQLDSAAAE
jgi:hypothetical protein